MLRSSILLLFLLITLQGLDAFMVASATSLDENGLIGLLPSNITSLEAIATPEIPWRQLDLGVFAIDPNAWGFPSLRDRARGNVTVAIDNRGVLCVKAGVEISEEAVKDGVVLAYPEVIYGRKPWGNKSFENRALPLPAEVTNLPEIHALINYVIAHSTTGVNAAFDIWLLKTGEPRQPGLGDVEVMIWLYRSGSTAPHPAGRLVGSLRQKVLLEGIYTDVYFDVWLEERIGDGWTYIAYVLREPVKKGEVLLNLTKIIYDSLNQLGLSPKDYYLHSIEFGFEVFSSRQVELETYVSKYILATGLRGHEELLKYSAFSKKLIAWITPWGDWFDPKSFNNRFVSGIIYPYDVFCGHCTSSLAEWADKQLELIEYFAPMGPVFINIFPEVYYPTWTWRGLLEDFELNMSSLSKLSVAIGKGADVFIGFSEMSACINNSPCLSKLIEAYRVLRKLFPLARFFYYGSGGEDPEKLIILWREAGLDLLGYDIWEYEVDNNQVKIPRHIAEKLSFLRAQLPAEKIIIGEIGFRLNDKEGYIEPWNKNRPIVYDEHADEKLYLSVLSDLSKKSLLQGFLGIWAWNDYPFAIMRDPLLQKAIAEAFPGKTSGYISETTILTTCSTGNYERGGLLLYVAVIALTLVIGILGIGLARKNGENSETRCCDSIPSTSRASGSHRSTHLYVPRSPF